MHYWTAFAYENFKPTAVHCTHKFLGYLSAGEVLEVVRLINLHMEMFEPSSFIVRFDSEKFFDKEDFQVRVLVPREENPLYHFKDFIILREELDFFRKDDYPFWNPHITTPKWDLVEKPFTRYVLAVDDKILREWRLK